MTDKKTILRRSKLERELDEKIWKRLDGAVAHLVGSVLLFNAASRSKQHDQYEAILARVTSEAATILNSIRVQRDTVANRQLRDLGVVTREIDSTPSALMAILMFPYCGGGERKRPKPRKPGATTRIPL